MVIRVTRVIKVVRVIRIIWVNSPWNYTYFLIVEVARKKRVGLREFRVEGRMI